MSLFEFISRDRFDGGIGEPSSVHRWLFHVFVVHGVVRRIPREASFCVIVPGPIRGRDLTLRRPVDWFMVYRGWSWIVSAIQTKCLSVEGQTPGCQQFQRWKGSPSEQVWTGRGVGLGVPVWQGENSRLGEVPMWQVTWDPPVDTDRHNWKHYLAANSICGLQTMYYKLHTRFSASWNHKLIDTSFSALLDYLTCSPAKQDSYVKKNLAESTWEYYYGFSSEWYTTG